MKEPYKNWEIEYIEENENFVATKDEHMLADPSLKQLKRKIDVFFFKREKAYYWTDDKLNEAEITSKVDDSYNNYRISYICTDYSGNPMKSNHGVKKGKLYAFNEKNKKLVEKINKLHDERNRLWEEIENLKKTLDPFEKVEKNV